MDNIGYENERVEFKENTTELDKGICSLVAMLNKNGNGTVFFGVKNNGDVAFIIGIWTCLPVSSFSMSS